MKLRDLLDLAAAKWAEIRAGRFTINITISLPTFSRSNHEPKNVDHEKNRRTKGESNA